MKTVNSFWHKKYISLFILMKKKNLQLINLLKIKVYKHISYLNFDILELKKKF